MLLNTILLLRWGLLLLVGWSALRHYGMTTFVFPTFYDSVFLASQPLPAVDAHQTQHQPFEWSDLDLTQKGSCGFSKCFFRSSLNDDEGYLLAKSKNGTKYNQRMFRVWKSAEQMSKEHGGRHFLLEPPFEVAFPPRSILKQLNKKAYGPWKTNKRYYGKVKRYNETLLQQAGASLVVQKVRVAPTPNLICRCYFFRKKKDKGRFKLDDLSASKEEFRLAVRDKRVFMSTFQTELERTVRLLTDGYFSRLFYDFQFLLDGEGKIHHIDMDRMENEGFTFPSQQGAEECFSGALRKVTKVLTGEHNNTDMMSTYDRWLDEATDNLQSLVKVVKPKKL